MRVVPKNLQSLFLKKKKKKTYLQYSSCSSLSVVSFISKTLRSNAGFSFMKLIFTVEHPHPYLLFPLVYFAGCGSFLLHFGLRFKARRILLKYIVSDTLWNSLSVLLTNWHYCRALKPGMFILLTRFHARIINGVGCKKGSVLNVLCSGLICCCYPTHGRLAYKLFLLTQRVLVLWLYLS